MNNMEEILKMALSKLKEEYGDDFKFEDGDEFIFTLNNAVLILSQEHTDLKIKIVLDTVIPLNVDFKMAEEGDV